MLWSKQFYYYVVRDWLNGDPGQPAPPESTPPRQELAVDAPVQLRRHLDAGQVGVPVVRRMGSGVPLRPARARRLRVRQGPTDPAAARVVHASQRAVAGVRVGAQRRESARARLGRLARLQDREAPARCRRSSVPRARLPQAADQLHVVGESEGRRGRRTSSRAASSASTTSASSIAARHCRPADIWSSPTARAGWACTH